MSGSRNNRSATVLAVLVGTTLLMAGSVRAQDSTTPRTIAVTVGQLPRDDEAKSGKQPLAVDLTTEGYITKLFVDQADETLGATLQPIGDVLRAQLDIPTGQGLLVASLNSDSPSAVAGLKQNDILLTLADKPLAVADDLTKQLKAAGESPIVLKVLRAGKPLEIQVRPIYHVTLGPVQERRTEYFIGVSINPADDALRAQLGLPADQGVVVTQVVSGSPAEKAGVKTHDVFLELGGKPIDSPEALTRQVETIEDKRTTLKLLRAGKSLILPITGSVRKVEVSRPMKLRSFTMGLPKSPLMIWNVEAPGQRIVSSEPAATEDLGQRVQHLEKELNRIEAVEKELREVHEALNKLNQKVGKRSKGE
jgi:C-terminal processing protease CtpA/Prc